jgi:DNA-directed RNA polymerase subunit RPC12/RpoP
MTLTFVCQSCDDSFELDYAQLVEDPKRIKCPNCGKRVPPSEMDEIATTLDELLAQVAAMRKRFAISLDIDAEDLPPPYDSDLKRAARGSDDEDEEEDDEDSDEELDEDVESDEDDDRF